ncbi:uncharacterized protein LOC106095384 [Stomoxys calcitrans]|uniref:Uncharacterized protein n=1 Tax=Stomoxys calcitrans TaxID=35570 RepID=A0A1I8PMN7_STOCA|nr:uncharacterized protein LOC106095384 [Stomoxys calcitrans]XP_013118075.1 uncharacterized protein LOC106095384 [Stomoxys calcitrans]XP_013118076.1 uncharacterized protein LOC106095384 [Stomoxys calcitrans]XP_013118077.1 uncharacterized protein LOC106095384 [Stomoxys calcitrans]
MVFKNCLKISYKGLTRNIICDALLRYEDIVSKIMETFDLTNIHRAAIQIYDEKGSKFDKDVFEYFLLLFPNPQKLFFIRLDSTKLIDDPSNAIRSQGEADTRYTFSISKTMNKTKNNNNSDNNVEAVPVRRQNCFIGQWPGSSNASPNTTTNLEPDRGHQRQQNQQNIVRGIVNRLKMFQESRMKRKTLTASSTPTVIKRSMRI